MNLVVLLVSLLSGDIRGLVVDPMGRPVPEAVITCNGVATPADGNGEFTISANEACEVTAVKLGFAKRTFTIKAGQENRIELVLASVSDEVVVTATGAPVALEEAGVAASVITESDMKVRNLNRVQDALRDVPGLTIVQTGSGGGTSSIFTRGGESNSTVVLLDGIPMNDPGGSLNNLIGMSTSGLERVEVVRGPESALYGAEAASGVIQLFSKRGDPEARIPHGLLIYERGSFSTDHWTAGLSGGLFGKLDYALTADQYRSTGQFVNNTFRNTTGSANIGYRFSPSTTLRAIFREFDSFTGAPGLTAYNAANLDAQSSDRDTAVGLRMDDARGARFTQRGTFSYHRLRNLSRDELSENYLLAALVRTEPGPIPSVYFVRMVTPTTTPDPGTSLVLQNYSTFPFGASLSLTDRTAGGYQATFNHAGGTLIGGYDYERQSGTITAVDVSRHNNGVSLYDQFAWRQRIFLAGGIRMENSNVFGWRFAPRGAVTFRLPTDTYVRVSVGRAIKQPSLLENFAVNPYYFGNPNLQPATTDSFETGLSREWFDRRLRTEFSYFYNRYTNLIQFVSDPVTFIGTWANVAKSRSHGIEISGTYRIASFVKARASYTKLDTQILQSTTSSDIGQQLLRRPDNSGAASLEFAAKRWTGIIGGRFMGESRDQFAQFGINRINPYNYVYLSATWQATKKLAPFFAINNLFNEQYQQVSGYASWSRNASGGLRVTW